MRKYLFLAIAFFNIIYLTQSCRNPGPRPVFTIKLRVVNGTTKRLIPDTVVELWFKRPNLIPSDFKVGSGKTDSSGNVIIKYQALDDDTTKIYAELKYEDRFVGFSNRNIDDTLFISDSGTMKIFLHTNKPLEIDHDTLYLCFDYQYKGQNPIEKVLKTTNGLYKIKRYATWHNQLLFWGRGWQSFHYDSYLKGFTDGSNVLYPNVRGDPYTDSITVNY